MTDRTTTRRGAQTIFEGAMMDRTPTNAKRACLGWGSAVAIATAALMGVMSAAPAAAQSASVQGLGEARVDGGGGDAATSRELILPLGKAAIVELPRAASDVLISNPETIEAVIRTPRRVYVMARETGQANAFFFDAQDRQILNLEIRVEADGDVIEDLIAKLMPTSRITVETMGDSVALHGTADSAGDAQRAVEIAARFTDGTGEEDEMVMNMITVRQPGQVMLKVRILEMQRRLIRQLGIDLNGVVELDPSNFLRADGTTGPELVGVGTRTGFAGTGALTAAVRTDGIGELVGLDAQLDAFEQNGLVKTLAEPSLIALSGETASFFAGGEVGYPVVQPGGLGGQALVTAEFKPFGVELTFQPTVRSKGSINIVLETKTSDVAAGLGVNQIPGFLERSATTTVDLPSGASFAIAGLLQQDIEETIQGVPGAKDVPVLGALFRSSNFQSDETELVIIATPYLVEPSTLAELTDPGEGFVPPTATEQFLLGRLEAAYGVNAPGVGEAGLQGPLGFILD